MAIYIVAFNPAQHYLSTSGQLTGFVEVTYKSKEGPLGFSTGQDGRKIFQALVKDATWFKESDQTFHLLDTGYLSRHTLHHFHGLFFMPDQWMEAEMKKHESNNLVRKKNLLLQRYDKPVLEEQQTIFSHIYSKTSKKYDSAILVGLCNDRIEVALGHSDSLGAHLIFHRTSVFMDRLINSCKEYACPIKYVSDEREIPAW